VLLQRINIATLKNKFLGICESIKRSGELLQTYVMNDGTIIRIIIGIQMFIYFFKNGGFLGYPLYVC